VHPFVPRLQAILTALRAWGDLSNLVEMPTCCRHTDLLLPPLQPGRMNNRVLTTRIGARTETFAYHRLPHSHVKIIHFTVSALNAASLLSMLMIEPQIVPDGRQYI